MKGTRALRRRPLNRPRLAERRLRPPRGASARLLIRSERWLGHHFSLRIWPRARFLRKIYDFQLDRTLRLVEGRVALRGLPSGWQGRRLLLMSDFHAGPFVSKGALERTIERLSAVDPDVVILAGDFVSASVEEIQKLRDGLRRLSEGAPTLGVLGNHDHYTDDIVGVGRELEALGVVVLHNRARVLEQGGDPLTFLGIDDWIVGEGDLSKVQRELPENGPSILLSHVPDSFFEAADLGVDLVLAGHTHGGQIRLPLVDRLVRVSRYPLVEGHYEYRSERSGKRGQLILSQGLGVVGLPLRFRCPPEATLITLERAE